MRRRARASCTTTASERGIAARALRQADRRHRRAPSCAALDELERRGQANGVPGLRRIDAAEIAELEPHARGIAGLHSPATGIVRLRRRGPRLRRRTCATRAARSRPAARCSGVVVGARALRLTHPQRRDRGAPRGLLRRRVGRPPRGRRRRRPRPADRAVPRRLPAACARAPAARALADLPGARPLAAVPRRAPDPAHRRRGADRPHRADGRRARRLPPRHACAARDLLDTLAWPGTWRMLARWWRDRRHRAAPRGAALAPFVRAAARYVPELRAARRRDRAFAGVRAQALGRDGRLSTTSSSRAPSARCTCATRRRRPRPPRWRSRATSATRPAERSTSSADARSGPRAPSLCVIVTQARDRVGDSRARGGEPRPPSELALDPRVG